MRTIQRIISWLLGLGILASGVLLIIMPLENIAAMAGAHKVDVHAVWFRLLVGILSVILGGIAILPLRRSRGRKGKVLSYAGEHGHVTIHLDSVEVAITRALSKLPEVKKAVITIIPTDENRKVRIAGDVVLLKSAEADVREMAGVLSKHIADMARRTLGVGEVTTIDLSVRGIVVEGQPADTGAQRTAQTVTAPQIVSERRSDPQPLTPIEMEDVRQTETAPSAPEPTPSNYALFEPSSRSGLLDDTDKAAPLKWDDMETDRDADLENIEILPPDKDAKKSDAE